MMDMGMTMAGACVMSWLRKCVLALLPRNARQLRMITRHPESSQTLPDKQNSYYFIS